MHAACKPHMHKFLLQSLSRYLAFPPWHAEQALPGTLLGCPRLSNLRLKAAQ